MAFSLSVEVLAGLSTERRQAILTRSMEDVTAIIDEIRGTVLDVRDRGDAALIEHYRKFKPDLAAEGITATREEIAAAYDRTGAKVVEMLRVAADNIRRFHQAQTEREMWAVEVVPGVLAGRLHRPLDIAGCYVPGRRAAYPSSVLMTIIPAKVAGVETVVACTPPNEGMVANDATLVAADIAGCDRVFKVGGPWAVGAMAYGTETIPRVHKIVGPGNKYVTAAKMAVFGLVDIDSPAGPSEVLILADDTADAEFVALDFLSQIEHDPDAAAVLITTCASLADRVREEIEVRMPTVARKEVVEAALKANSAILVADSMHEALEFTNEYAAEHLEIVTRDPMSVLPRIRHAGSIFLGPWAPVPVGDYASGTNHVLPTGQCAKMFSGLSVDDFVKKPTFQMLSREGIRSLGEAVMTLAEVEGLPLHKEAVRARWKRLEQEANCEGDGDGARIRKC